jgi:hypothetical protein
MSKWVRITIVLTVLAVQVVTVYVALVYGVVPRSVGTLVGALGIVGGALATLTRRWERAPHA